MAEDQHLNRCYRRVTPTNATAGPLAHMGGPPQYYRIFIITLCILVQIDMFANAQNLLTIPPNIQILFSLINHCTGQPKINSYMAIPRVLTEEKTGK